MKQVIQVKEFHGLRAASFLANDTRPEETAWNLMRGWAVENVPNYAARTYIGYAPRGHHPDGEEHRDGGQPVAHEYMAQMLLLQDEATGDSFLGAEVTDAPEGLFLVGDVVFSEHFPDGEVDIGASMKRWAGPMLAYLEETACYRMEMDARPLYEEHIFPKEWFGGAAVMADMRMWLPIERI